MKKRYLKKRDVLREGYVKGLKAASNLIKESLSETDGGRTFIAKHIETRRVRVDGVNGGEIGSETNWSHGYLGEFEFSKPEEFLQYLKRYVGDEITDSSFWVDVNSGCGRVIVKYLADEDGDGLSDREFEAWEHGKLTAYEHRVEFRVRMVQKDTADILIKEFGWDY